MSNLLQAAQEFVKSNNVDQMANVPWKQAAINAIMSGDAEAGQKLANNVLQSYGFSSPEEAIQRVVNK